MRRLSVVGKLWLAFTALILVVLVPLEVALDRLLTDFYGRQVTEPLLYHSRQLAEMMMMDPDAIHMAPAMGKMVGGEVMVIDSAGRHVPFPGSSGLTPPAPAVAAARAGSTYVGQSGEYIVAAAPIQNGGGTVLLLAPAGPVKHSLDLARRFLWSAGVGTLVAGGALALWLSRSLLRPVIAIEQATRRIARGDFTTRVEVPSADEIGRLAGAVNQMTGQLEAYESRRREFLANVAHELRTPLSYIRGYTQAMSEGLVTQPEEQERYQRIIQEEAVRLGRLVDDLMDLAQLEEGQMSMDLSPLDLRLPLEQAAATIRPLAEEKGVTVTASVPDGLPHPLADGGRVQQVVFNLLDNALRHTPAGGSVSVTARATGDLLTVQVSDSGPGIEADALPLVFERFHRRHSSGRGLGLAIVRSIVRAHGGEVGVESRPGEGATFWFTLPTGSVVHETQT